MRSSLGWRAAFVRHPAREIFVVASLLPQTVVFRLKQADCLLRHPLENVFSLLVDTVFFLSVLFLFLVCE